MEVRQNLPFTAFGTDKPDIASISSIMASLMLGSSTRPELPPPTVEVTGTPAAIVDSSTSVSEQRTPTTLSTLPTSSRPSISSSSTASLSSPASSTPTSTTTGPSGTSAANSSEAGSSSSEACHGISCSPGTQAAVAVPVVVGVLALIGLIVFVARRRRRRLLPSDITKEKPKKKWTRHLRIFSFDHELLGGGRFSSSNSMRSGGSSQHVAGNSRQRDNPSLDSIDDAAPPYASHVQPGMAQTGPGLAAGALATTALPRSTSRASAPPPYGQTENRAVAAPTTPTRAEQNPFSDSHLANPTENTSPFVDPSDDGRSTSSRPAVSRNSSIRSGTQHDDTSMMVGSEAGSIREAQVGRHVSVASGGRITHIRNSSQSPPSTD